MLKALTKRKKIMQITVEKFNPMTSSSFMSDIKTRAENLDYDERLFVPENYMNKTIPTIRSTVKSVSLRLGIKLKCRKGEKEGKAGVFISRF